MQRRLIGAQKFRVQEEQQEPHSRTAKLKKCQKQPPREQKKNNFLVVKLNKMGKQGSVAPRQFKDFLKNDDSEKKTFKFGSKQHHLLK